MGLAGRSGDESTARAGESGSLYIPHDPTPDNLAPLRPNFILWRPTPTLFFLCCVPPSPLQRPTSSFHVKLHELRDLVVVAPRPPHRSNSLGSGSSVAKSTLGGVLNKHISVERLRHSISVARGHHNTSGTSNNYGGSSSSGNNSSAGTQVSTPVAFQGDNYNQGRSIGGVGGRTVLVRRHSHHSSSSSSGGSGWSGANQAPSYQLSVGPAGSSGSGGVVGEVSARGIRPAKQVF